MNRTIRLKRHVGRPENLSALNDPPPLPGVTYSDGKITESSWGSIEETFKAGTLFEDLSLPEQHPEARAIPGPIWLEFRALVEDIQEQGQLAPIWMLDSQILDGVHRFAAAKLTRLQPWVEEAGEDVRADPTAFAISMNMTRRHLNTGQRAFVALALKPRFEADAAKRRSLGRNGASQGRAADLLGRCCGVSGDSIETAEKIQKADPSLARRVISGELTLNAAAKELRLAQSPQSEHREDLKPTSPKPAETEPSGRHHSKKSRRGTVGVPICTCDCAACQECVGRTAPSRR